MSNEKMLFTSLNDLAAMDTSDVSVLRNRLQKAGIYIINFTEAGFKQAESDDPSKKPRVTLGLTGLILSYEPLKDGDGEAEEAGVEMEGKAYREFYTMWMDDIQETIGLLKGKYDSAHLSTFGVMGGVEGTEGWVDKVVGSNVAIRVRHKRVGDDTRVYYDWLGFKALKKLGISWDEMGRPALDRNGNEIDVNGED